MISSISDSDSNAELEGLDWCTLDELGPAVLVGIGLAVMGVVGSAERLGGARRSTTGVISAIVLGSISEEEEPNKCVLDVLSLTILGVKRGLDLGVTPLRSVA